MSDRIWFNTAQAADHAGCHPDTVRKALESGDLHGSQRKARGRWRIHRHCLDDWCEGAKCEHEKRAA